MNNERERSASLKTVGASTEKWKSFSLRSSVKIQTSIQDSRSEAIRPTLNSNIESHLIFTFIDLSSELSLGGKVQFLHSLQNKMCTMTPKDFRALHLLDLTLMNKTRRVFEYDYIGSIFVRNLFLLSSCFSIQMHSQKIEVILIPRSNF